MKKIGIWTLAMLFGACQQVIDLDLPTQPAEMVIDAAIDWEKGTQGKEQKIILRQTTGYYDESLPQGISGAQVQVKNGQGRVFSFAESTEKGVYLCPDFAPQLDAYYTLEVAVQGKNYTSLGKMRSMPPVSLDNITQNNNGGVFKDKKELKVKFKGVEGKDNYYALRVRYSFQKLDYLYTLDGSNFSNQNLFFTINGTSERELQTGDQVQITFYRISWEYKTYLDLLLNASSRGGNVGAPTFTIPSRVYGNITCQQGSQYNPMGGFRVAQFSTLTYTVK